jgi:nitrate reductase NapE component
METKSISKHAWVENFRFVSIWLVWSVGSFACLAFIFGLLAGPPSPPANVSYEEHMHRVENGYYMMRDFRNFAVTLAYLFVFSIPQRWLVRSRVRVIPTIILLALPPVICFARFIVALFHKWPDQATFIFVLIMDTFFTLFFLLAPWSLFFSWKFRKEEFKTSSPPRF